MNFLKTIIGFCLIYYISETASEAASVSASITDLVDGIVELVLRVIQLILDLVASITAPLLGLLGPKLDPQKEALILVIDTAIQGIEAAQESPLISDSTKNTLAFIAFLLKVERNLLADNSIPLNIEGQTVIIQKLQELVTGALNGHPFPKCPNACDVSVEIQKITCECYTSPEVRQFLKVHQTFAQISDLLSSSKKFTLAQGVSVSTVLDYFATLRAATGDFLIFIYNNTDGVYDRIVLSTKFNAFIQASEAFNALFGFE